MDSIHCFLCTVESCSIAESGRTYTGPEDITASGQPCANGTGVGYNKCSNSKKKQLWCYLDKDRALFDFCDVPVCTTVTIRGKAVGNQIISLPHTSFLRIINLVDFSLPLPFQPFAGKLMPSRSYN